ncbi:MAG: sulfatase-like hydrolase/transferase, partial [Chloroflexota bacterium]|nr:sulfatase-like hydrolase/transferase [Chloroflexota bacterium]
PNLDALAARGTVFRRGYIQNPICIPSRACLMTGRYVHQHGVEHMEPEIGATPGLPPWERTVQERLRAEGYATAAFGKIHQLPPRGWDETALTMGKGARWTVAEGSPLGPSQLGPVYAEWLEAKRPGAYESIYAQRRRPEYREQATAVVNTLAADEYVDYWIGENTWKYLDRPGVGRQDRPFFLWCGFCGPHGPFDPPEPYASMFRPDEMPLSPLLRARQRNAPGADRTSRFDTPNGAALARKLTAYYWGMVTFIDDMLGRIMDVLTRRGLWENTLVIFTTDHGEMLGDFGRMGKETFTEAVIRAPYIVVPPAGALRPNVSPPLAPPRAGTTQGLTLGRETQEPQGHSHGQRPGLHFVDSLVEHIDLVPTILDYAGVAQPGELPGISLRPVLESLPGEARPRTKDAILCEFVPGHRQQRFKCVRTERYKYVFGGPADAAQNGQAVQFYDLQQDPLETENVAADPQYRAEIERHAQLLLQRLTWTEQTPWNSGGAGAAPPAALDHFGRPLLPRPR